MMASRSRCSLPPTTIKDYSRNPEQTPANITTSRTSITKSLHPPFAASLAFLGRPRNESSRSLPLLEASKPSPRFSHALPLSRPFLPSSLPSPSASGHGVRHPPPYLVRSPVPFRARAAVYSHAAGTGAHAGAARRGDAAAACQGLIYREGGFTGGTVP